MVSAISCAVVVLMLLGVAHAQNGQGSSAQRPLGVKFATLACAGAAPRYTATSSVLGLTVLKKGAATGVDYALSDLSVQPCDTRLVNVPYAIGVMSVHVRVGTALRAGVRLSACVLDRIYKCSATTWNAAVITALNPSLRTITARIRPISRADVSGTTFTFTNYVGKGCPTLWRYGSITTFNNALDIKPCVASHIRGAGTGGVRTASASPNIIAYINAGNILTPVALKATVAAGYFLPTALNTATLLSGVNVGTATCSRLFDITGVRTQNTYPLAYMAFFIAFQNRPGRANPPSVKALCNCIVNRKDILVAGLPDFRAIPTNIQNIARTRCGLIRP